MLAVFAQFVGVQPDDFVLILIVGRLVESWSHANVDMSFGRLGARLLVGAALPSPAPCPGRRRTSRTSTTTISRRSSRSGTCCSARRASTHAPRPTGVDDAEVDADNGRGWLGQQVRVFKRFVAAVTPLKLKAS